MRAETEGDRGEAGLEEGGYVVHVQHGIGVYRGVETLQTPVPAPPEAATGSDGPERVTRDYLLLEFDRGDRLYVPAEQADRVQPYVGAAAPKLNRLSGAGWAKSVAAAKRQVEGEARRILQRQAERMAARGHAYGPDSAEQRKMEAAFPHDETPAQQDAIADVKRDLEAPRPMDRLIVGDVGYGKTEVAVRAAFKVACAGRQVAVLCPTSVLASQHFATFTERMAGFPLRVELLSRFRAAADQEAVVAGLQEGAIDVVVGTHRLLSADVSFKNLGLVIVDEEQRFGVAQKERLKELRATVDILTMTATPIPRTLNLAEVGLRDVSLVNDPPQGRSPVETVVAEYDEGLVREALVRELSRGGQVYYLHNRVETLEHVADRLRELAPDARLRVAHGQMAEEELEDAVAEFYEGRADVLVCTTIIETGLDVPNANTLIVDGADRFGLAQLYQLRGRVGRSDRQAYALLLYRRGEGQEAALSDVALERLQALREHNEEGAGYLIARRDLELRGAGELLGEEQSGAAASAVGMEMYLQLLGQALRRVQGRKLDPAQVPLPPVDLPVPAGIPADYVPSASERLTLFRRMAAVREDASLAALKADIAGRYGPPPPQVETEFALSRLRLLALKAGVRAITVEAGHVNIAFRRELKPDSPRLRALAASLKEQGHAFTPEKVSLTLPPTGGPAALLPVVEGVLKSIIAAARSARARKPSGAPPKADGARE